MALDPKDVRIDGKDQRQGMGIGGWHMRFTASHEPTGCSVSWETRGNEPRQWEMRDRAMMALELLVEAY